MAKQEVYWFHHDGNAHRDIKILEMRLVYGSEGYGWWWILLELMREATDYKLRYSGKHDLKMLAKELETDADTLKSYINDCVNDFGLFNKDDDYFWSPSMLRRMKVYGELCEKRRQAGSRSHVND
jgi:hypothetical protein